MRYKLEKYQGKVKHTFTAEVTKKGSYLDRDTGEKKKTILFTNVRDEKGKIVTDHVWVKEDSYLKDQTLTKGKVYTFEAKIGTYNFRKPNDESMPAMPGVDEIEVFNRETVDQGETPYWKYNGKRLKSIWDDVIEPIAEDEGLDPWDVAGVFFSFSHGMEFVYDNGKPVGIRKESGT